MAFVPVGFLFKQRDGRTFRFNPFKWSKSPEDDYREDPIKVFVPQEPWDDVFRAPQSDAKLAEKDAEIARLRDLLERLRDVVSRGMTQSVPIPGQQYPIGSHHHPIWVEIANALEGTEA